MIALIDYDAGNIKSVEKAFQSLGKEVVLTRDPEVLKRADHVVLPGVGSFGDAMENLNRYHLVPVIHEIVDGGRVFQRAITLCFRDVVCFDSGVFPVPVEVVIPSEHIDAIEVALRCFNFILRGSQL